MTSAILGRRDRRDERLEAGEPVREGVMSKRDCGAVRVEKGFHVDGTSAEDEIALSLTRYETQGRERFIEVLSFLA